MLKHPVHFLACNELEDTGLTAMAFGFIADVVAGLMILFHAAAIAGLVPSKVAKGVSVLIWFVLSVGFFIVVVLGAVIYTKEWTCDQPVIPTLTLKDHFDLNYGLPFAVVGWCASVLALVISLFVVSSEEAEAAPSPKKTAKLTHVLCVALALVAFVTAVLSDGRSVITLKDSKDLPIATDP